MFKTILQTVLDTLFPPLADPNEVDLAALSEVAVVERYQFQTVDDEHMLYATASYADETIASVVRQLKFKGRRIAAHFLSALLVRALTEEPSLVRTSPWIIVPIPLAPSRQRTRGYNQAALIAELVVSSTDRAQLPAHAVLRRTRETAPQTSLDRADRAHNVIGAFSVNDHAFASYQHAPLLLLDDVITTGATLREARKALLDAGACDVIGIAVAH